MITVGVVRGEVLPDVGVQPLVVVHLDLWLHGQVVFVILIVILFVILFIILFVI